MLLARRGRKPRARPAGGWSSGLLLALYAAPFAFAYLQLTTGTGALLLFGSVQLTMVGSGLISGERPRAMEWSGLAIAALGLTWFLLPGVDRAPLLAAVLMIVAGVAWGLYSVRGRASKAPIIDTAANFLWALPFMLLVSAVSLPGAAVTISGTAYAIASGAVASGIGYAVWYSALRGLTSTQAAGMQLAVPVLAAIAGVVILQEPLTARLVLAGSTVLIGIAIIITSRTRDHG